MVCKMSYKKTTAQSREINSLRTISQAKSVISIKKRNFSLLAINKEITNYSRSSFIVGHSWHLSNNLLSN